MQVQDISTKGNLRPVRLSITGVIDSTMTIYAAPNESDTQVAETVEAYLNAEFINSNIEGRVTVRPMS